MRTRGSEHIWLWGWAKGSSPSTLPWLPRGKERALPAPGVLPRASQAIQKGWPCFASPWESLASPGWCEEWIRSEKQGLLGGCLSGALCPPSVVK